MIRLDQVEDIEGLKKEAKLHQQLSSHESIITIIEYFIDANMLIIVTQYASSRKYY